MDEDFFGPSQTKNKKNYAVMILGAVLITVVLGFLVWTFTQKNKVSADQLPVIVNQPKVDNVADWKIYNNTKYAYTIKYLNNWMVDEKDPTAIRIYPDNLNDHSDSGLTIEVKEDVGDKTIDDLIKEAYPNNLFIKTETRIGNYSGFSVKTNCQTDNCSLAEEFVLKDNLLYRVRQNQNISLTIFNEMVATLKFNSIASVSVLKIDKLKTYTNQDLGFSFGYPDAWANIELFPMGKDILSKGDALTSLYKIEDTQPVYVDPDSIFSFVIYSKDFDNGVISAPTSLKVDPNWTKDDFIAKTKAQSWVAGYKKLSDNALLVITHADVACFPNFQINVFVPTANSNYPNFIINIDSTDVDKDQTVIDYLHFQGAGGKSVCDTRLPYQEISDRIVDGTYSIKMKASMDQAQKIADSFKNLQ